MSDVEYILRHLDKATKDPVGFVAKFINRMVSEEQIKQGQNILKDLQFIVVRDDEENRKQMEH